MDESNPIKDKRLQQQQQRLSSVRQALLSTEHGTVTGEECLSLLFALAFDVAYDVGVSERQMVSIFNGCNTEHQRRLKSRRITRAKH